MSCVEYLGLEQESAMRRKSVAPRLKMQSSPIKESKLAILEPRKIEDNGNHNVGAMPVARRTEGPRSHMGHLKN
jgi:hypothetical protein